ncbi:MAG: DUF2911 domain-containing protein, partial [Cyclobacteriaceae bacterium]|nr:DUF2911 domain-containing protein [Cyclobacteriaceae bacterium]
MTIEGQSIPAGEYLFFSIPGATQWEVMLYNDISIGGNTANYDKSKEQARFTVAPQKLTETVETLTFNIADISDDNTTAAIQIAWENTSVKLGLKVDFDSKVMAQIEKSTQVSPGTYRDAANYYFNSDRDINQAVEWMETFLNSSPDQQF